MDFLFVLIELFSLGVTAEAQTNADCNLRLEGGGPVSGKFSRRTGRPPQTIFARIDRPMNALQLCR